MKKQMRNVCLVGLLCLGALTTLAQEAAPNAETVCDDGQDNDGDTVYDCGDSDCMGTNYCKALKDGQGENTAARCQDFVDNDSDGDMDCDDQECMALEKCAGSWNEKTEKTATTTEATAPATQVVVDAAAPQDSANGSLVGKEGNPSPETVVQDKILGSSEVEEADSDFDLSFAGIRFGFTGIFTQQFQYDNVELPTTWGQSWDTRMKALQLRMMGKLPYLEDSFFLISTRLEGKPRVTFAIFQVPTWRGHYVAITTGGGTLSAQPVVSVAKHSLIEGAFYLTNAFDLRTGVSVEANGNFFDGKLRYRAFVGGGALDEATGSDKFFTAIPENYTYSAGLQGQLNVLGYYSRLNSEYMYTYAEPTVAFLLGGKFTQAAQERFPAGHAQAVLKWKFLQLIAEDYIKYELNFGSMQNAYNVQLGALLVPKHLFLAADFGQYYAGPMSNPPSDVGTDIARQKNETQWRAALHLYFWRQNGVLSLLYKGRMQDASRTGIEGNRTEPFVYHSALLAASFKF